MRGKYRSYHGAHPVATDPQVRQAWLGFVDSGLPEGDPLPPLPDGCFAVQPIEVAAEQ